MFDNAPGCCHHALHIKVRRQLHKQLSTAAALLADVAQERPQHHQQERSASNHLQQQHSTALQEAVSNRELNKCGISFSAVETLALTSCRVTQCVARCWVVLLHCLHGQTIASVATNAHHDEDQHDVQGTLGVEQSLVFLQELAQYLAETVVQVVPGCIIHELVPVAIGCTSTKHPFLGCGSVDWQAQLLRCRKGCSCCNIRSYYSAGWTPSLQKCL
jgi:hypothetical protein